MNLPRYKRNLHIDGAHVYSYSTHVATIDRARGVLIRHGWWSVTTSKHINYVAAQLGLTIEDGGIPETIDEDDRGATLRTVAMVAALGDTFHAGNQAAANDWKARMLRAGLEGRGLIMPDDWAELSEDEKERRLNGALAELRSA